MCVRVCVSVFVHMCSSTYCVGIFVYVNRVACVFVRCNDARGCGIWSVDEGRNTYNQHKIVV